MFKTRLLSGIVLILCMLAFIITGGTVLLVAVSFPYRYVSFQMGLPMAIRRSWLTSNTSAR